MKKAIVLTALALSHLFLASAHAESTTIEPSLPQDVSSWQKVGTTCDKHAGKHIVMTSYLLRGRNDIALGINMIQLNGKKVVQSESLVKDQGHTFQHVRTHVINSRGTPQFWTKFEFAVGDSKREANARILEALGLTSQQFVDCKF